MATIELLNLPKIYDVRGNLTFIENQKHIPFEVRRVFYLYDVPAGETRAGHALKNCQQFIIAVSGSFDVIVDNGKKKSKFTLNRPYIGLFLPALCWRELENFSSGSVCLVLASELYNENEYIYNYEDFQNMVRGKFKGKNK
jgi:hypothetical protein